MFQRLANIAESAAGLFQAKAKLVIRDVESAAVSTGIAIASRLIAGVMLLVGGLILLAALVLVLGPEIGWPAAVAVGGGVLVLGGGVIFLTAGRSKPSGPPRPTREDLEREAVACQEALKAAASPAPEPDAQPGAQPRTDPLHGWDANRVTNVLHTITSNPQALASAAFAVVSVLGPWRSLRVLGKTATAAGVAASVAKAVNSWKETMGSANPPYASNGRAATPEYDRAGRL